MKRFFVIALVLLSAAFASAQTQNAAVKHNTYLRQGPSVDDKKVLLLKTGDELELIDPAPTDNYYHVRTLDGEEGFAYVKNVTVKPAPEKLRTDLAAPSGAPAENISDSWEKPTPK
jgi:uncharacterized protein YgiM (DUF1202 family)